jgi:hypothetical protein
MKTLKLMIALMFTLTLSAQSVYNLTYLDVPIQEIGKFVQLHNTITDMTVEKRGDFGSEFLFTHFQGSGPNVVIWTNYATVEDVYNDERVNAIGATWEALPEDERGEFEDLVRQYLPYWTGHSDEIRTVDYEKNVLFSEDMDWDTNFLILLMDYSTTGEAGPAFNNWITKPQVEAGVLLSGGFSTHLSGAGSDLQVWSLYPDMMTYAKSFSVSGDVEARKAFFGAVGGSHTDTMYRNQGYTNGGKFNLSGPNRE